MKFPAGAIKEPHAERLGHTCAAVDRGAASNTGHHPRHAVVQSGLDQFARTIGARFQWVAFVWRNQMESRSLRHLYNGGVRNDSVTSFDVIAERPGHAARAQRGVRRRRDRFDRTLAPVSHRHFDHLRVRERTEDTALDRVGDLGA